MNKTRRACIHKLADNLEGIVQELEQIISDEDDYRDNMPENLQTSEKYEYSEECSDKMEDVTSTLTEQLDILREI